MVRVNLCLDEFRIRRFNLDVQCRPIDVEGIENQELFDSSIGYLDPRELNEAWLGSQNCLGSSREIQVDRPRIAAICPPFDNRTHAKAPALSAGIYAHSDGCFPTRLQTPCGRLERRATASLLNVGVIRDRNWDREIVACGENVLDHSALDDGAKIMHQFHPFKGKLCIRR